jgi:hypothetical protein
MELCTQMVQERHYAYMHLSIMLGFAELQPEQRVKLTEDGWLVSVMLLRIILCVIILVMICILSDMSKAIAFRCGMRTTQLTLTPTGTLSLQIQTPSCMEVVANGGRCKSVGLNSYRQFRMCVNIPFRMNQLGNHHLRPLVSHQACPRASPLLSPALCPVPSLVPCPLLRPQPDQHPRLCPQSTPRLRDRRPPRRSRSQSRSP